METGLTYTSTVVVSKENGAMMNTTHIKPSAVGDTVSATAVLKEVEGRKLTFEVRAQDSKGVIGEGTHVRYIVDKEKFMSKLS